MHGSRASLFGIDYRAGCPARRASDAFFRPSGAFSRSAFGPHGLRRGLHSFAASRLVRGASSRGSVSVAPASRRLSGGRPAHRIRIEFLSPLRGFFSLYFAPHGLRRGYILLPLRGLSAARSSRGSVSVAPVIRWASRPLCSDSVSFAPTGLFLAVLSVPTACAVGYILLPLRGFSAALPTRICCRLEYAGDSNTLQVRIRCRLEYVHRRFSPSR